MKTIKQVQTDCIGDVLTFEEFVQCVNDGALTSWDGFGFFHDGEKETEVWVFDKNLTWDDIKDYPYVCWYNK